MSMPLNQLLYDRLKAVFGHVNIVNAGQTNIVEKTIYYDRQRKLRHGVGIRPGLSGEEYAVNCPFCPDTGKHLYLNYRWGTYPQGSRFPNLHPAHCFRNNCIDSFEKCKQLFAMVFPDSAIARQVKLPAIPPKQADAPPPPKPELPPDCVLVEQLPLEHPACRYLASRGFDPHAIAKGRELRYCEFREHGIIVPRIVIPCFKLVPHPEHMYSQATKELAGWQARLIGPPPYEDAPKYRFPKGMEKSRLLYGAEKAIHTTGPVVLVEGTVDVWKVGDHGMALLGKTLSSNQYDRLLRAFSSRPVLVMLDNDAADAAKKIVSSIIVGRHILDDSAPVLSVSPPPGRKDPGEASSAELRTIITEAMRKYEAGE
ncbi:MAG: hypothetical protein FWD61_15400 [Phycisphaerales bacterium]|nr:hypothetical protein [Phycisphaerales bacterium]